MIHPTASVSPKAKIDASVWVGPFAVIDADVVVAADCWVGPHVHLTGWTVVGPGNRFHTGCVIGDAPQDLRYRGEATRLEIGEGNTFREHVTVHRSNTPDEATVIGSHNLLMAHCHVGHNARLGDRLTIANAALIGGHVSIGDRVFVSGHCLIHQFVRIGTLALMQGGAGVSKDVPPFTVAAGINQTCGLNTVGLRRAGVGPADRLELRGLYRDLFRSGRVLSAALAAARVRAVGPHAQAMLEFIASSRRGVCRHGRRRLGLEPADEPGGSGAAASEGPAPAA
jgi:UDP-N-acetylglucosamine acyltransferase